METRSNRKRAPGQEVKNTQVKQEKKAKLQSKTEANMRVIPQPVPDYLQKNLVATLSLVFAYFTLRI
jgi:hypothetical protein